jgi:hypothetical protein
LHFVVIAEITELDIKNAQAMLHGLRGSPQPSTPNTVKPTHSVSITLVSFGVCFEVVNFGNPNKSERYYFMI